MKFIIAVAAAAAALGSGAAHAQDATPTGAYTNLGYAAFGSEPGPFDAIQGKFGYRFLPLVGVEGELAFGAGSESVNVPTGLANPATVEASVKLKHELAGYVVGFVPLGANTDLIVRVGYGSTKAGVKGAGISPQESHESVNYGIGFQHYFGGVNGIRLDWTHLDFRHGYGSYGTVVGVAYSRRF